MENVNNVEATVTETVAVGFFDKVKEVVNKVPKNNYVAGGLAVAGAGLLGYAGYRAYKSYKAKGEAKTAVERAREAAEQHAANSQS